ncbi:lipoprotein [Aurantimonas sp. 22II-16-19i]|nr:lipoprotein [Aurantimonas sp. 22II-16-19i]
MIERAPGAVGRLARSSAACRGRRRPARHLARLALAVVLLLAPVVGLASPVVDDARPAAGSRPAADAALALDAFFDGQATSQGTITTLLVFREPFTARFSGRVAGNRLKLDERFRFEDGKRLQRWDLTRSRDGRYRGTVTTELGDGTMAPPASVVGWTFAGGVVLAYDGYAPGGGRTLLGFRHVMRTIAPGTVRNRVTISKFGVAIASSDVIFRRAGR